MFFLSAVHRAAFGRRRRRRWCRLMSFLLLSFDFPPLHVSFVFPFHVYVCLSFNICMRCKTNLTGSFDPMSSLWPRTAADFAFSQDCEEGPGAFLSRERGLSGSEVGLAADSGARKKPVDEVSA